MWSAMSYFVGGAETTTALTNNIVWKLLEVPERWERLRAVRYTACNKSFSNSGLFSSNRNKLTTATTGMASPRS